MCPLKEAARDVPHVPAVDSLSYAELDRLVDIQVTKLSDLGIQVGDRIAACHLPKLAMIVLFFAAWRLGASVCPLNTRLPTLPLERIQPRLLFDTQQLFPSTPAAPSSLFLFTSGSTGKPKIAILSLKNLIASAQGALEALSFQPKDRWLLSLPLYHVGGIGILFRAILGRGTVVLNERDPSITHLSHVPTQLYRAWPIYPHLKCLLVGGGPLRELPSQLPIVSSYGLTEMASVVRTNRLLPGRQMRIADNGEIWVRGECRFQGYWGEKAPFDEEGWFPTGDLWNKGTIQRKDWMFISGGENIQPEEIEQCLLQMPEVREAVVLPKSDLEFGHRPIAVLSAECTESQIRSFLSKHLPKYKVPTSFYFVDELPKIGLKIDRKLLSKNFSYK